MPDTPVPQPAAVPSDEAKENRGKKLPDTVRQRKKKNPKASAQRFLPIAEIRNDALILKNGGLRAVLEVEALNFNLKSEVEQQGIIAGYQSFINSITFPIQIVMMSRKVNIDPYIQGIRDMADKHTNELLRQQSIDYADFVQKIIDVADIMQKHFYVVIPLDDIQPKHSPFAAFLRWFGIDDSQSKAVERYRYFIGKNTKLKERLNLVESGLNSIGLITHQLTTHELIELYYKAYNPQTSHHQPIRGEINADPLVL